MGVNTILSNAVGFLTSREFAVNFVANLGGVIVGVLVALWIERVKARRDARAFYGRTLQSSRYELEYLQRICASFAQSLRAGPGLGTIHSFGAPPATKALLMSSQVHDLTPYSLIMSLTTLCSFLEGIENALRNARQLKLGDPAASETLRNALGDQQNRASKLIAVALEQIDSQLKVLGLTEKTPDAVTQEVSRKLREALSSTQTPLPNENSPPNPAVLHEGQSDEAV